MVEKNSANVPNEMWYLVIGEYNLSLFSIPVPLIPHTYEYLSISYYIPSLELVSAMEF